MLSFLLTFYLFLIDDTQYVDLLEVNYIVCDGDLRNNISWDGTGWYCCIEAIGWETCEKDEWGWNQRVMDYSFVNIDKDVYKIGEYYHLDAGFRHFISKRYFSRVSSMSQEILDRPFWNKRVGFNNMQPRWSRMLDEIQKQTCSN